MISLLLFTAQAGEIEQNCSREELNLHGFPHTVLSRTRLPFRHVSEANYNAPSARGCNVLPLAAAAFAGAGFELLRFARFAK